MRLCWADKIPLALYLAAVAFLLFLGGTAKPPHDAAWFNAGVNIMWLIFYKFVAPLWIFLRLIDLLMGGPGKRRLPMVTYMPPSSEPWKNRSANRRPFERV
jgi:hypothetical protein